MSTERRLSPLPARVFMARQIMRRRARALRTKAAQVTDQDSPHAAALRGKAKGYDEAAVLVEKLDKGRRMRKVRS